MVQSPWPSCRPGKTDKTEAVENARRIQVDGFRNGPQGLSRLMDEAENAQCGVRQRGEGLGQARSFGVVAVFVPPAVFDEVQAVLHLPVVASGTLQSRRGDEGRIKTGDEIVALGEEDLTLGRTHFAIDAHRDLTTGES